MAWRGTKATLTDDDKRVYVEQNVPLVRKGVKDLAAWLLSTPSKEGSAQTREMGVKLSAEPIDEEFLSGTWWSNGRPRV